jgi:hypothetical protein
MSDIVEVTLILPETPPLFRLGSLYATPGADGGNNKEPAQLLAFLSPDRELGMHRCRGRRQLDLPRNAS